MKKCVLICNPTSGKGSKEKLTKEFQNILDENGYETKTYFTKYSGHAGKIAYGLADDIDLLISLGGDGTFSEVVAGNLERQKKLLLSHIPLGTTNDLGAMFGMGKNPINNLKMILEGEVRSLDICEINGRSFVYVAGLGKFTNIAYDTPRKLKKNFGYLAYLIGAIKSFNRGTKTFEMEVTTTEETHKGLYTFILVCNASRMGGLDIFDDVKMNDGKIEVLMTNITKKKDIIKSLYLLTTSDITKVPGFYFFRTDYLKVKLNSLPRHNWCIDGEEFKSKDKEFELKVAHDVEMLLPSKELDKIFLDKANK